jgi:hypothetical protein
MKAPPAGKARKYDSWWAYPDVSLDACRSFLRERLTYISLSELDGGTVVKKSVRLADILATIDQIAGEHGHLDAFRWN